MPFEIRDAAERDAAACLEIYRPHVEASTTSFELEAPGVSEMAGRIAAARQRHAWLVAVEGKTIVGYAYAGAHRAREAYRYTAEVSAYVAPQTHGRGIGRRLYQRLFEVLTNKGYCNVVAGITLPNDPSVAFHERLGFRRLGVFHAIGYKFDAWRDTAWYERRLIDGPPPVEQPG